MAGRLTRFLNLEKPRRASDEPPTEVLNKARFEPPPQQEIPLAVDSGEQPFVRCPSCEADNNRDAERCFNCERSLLGDEVRAWNAAFWEKRKAEPPAPPQQPPPREPPRPWSWKVDESGGPVGSGRGLFWEVLALLTTPRRRPWWWW